MRCSMIGVVVLVLGPICAVGLPGCAEDPLKPTPKPPEPEVCADIGTCFVNGPVSDDNPCTRDECDDCGHPVHFPMQNAACDIGIDPNNRCEEGICKDGTCVRVQLPDGSTCLDFPDPKVCAPLGVCIAGVCTGGDSLICKPDEFCYDFKCAKYCGEKSWHASVPNNCECASMAADDLSGDGTPDLIVANYGRNTVSVLMNDGSGSFQNVEYEAGPHPTSVAVADLNGDGMNDLAVANKTWNTVTLLLNDGFGVFVASALYPLGFEPAFIISGDLNGDGQNDLVVGGQNDVTLVLLNGGNAGFAQKVSYDGGTEIAIADMNGDNHPDLAVTSSTPRHIGILFNKGDGSFDTKVEYPMEYEPVAIAVADINADGHRDLVIGLSYGLGVMLNNGDGTFATKTDILKKSFDSPLVAADISGDGWIDLAVAPQFDNVTSLLINAGDGTFNDALPFYAGINLVSSLARDFNGDGKLDLATLDYYGGVTIMLNECLQ